MKVSDIISLCCMTEQEKFTYLQCFLNKYYNKGRVVVSPSHSYMFAVGDISICLIAHIDNVFNQPPQSKDFLHDQAKHILWGGGCGFDDAAGIYAIMQIVKDGYRPHIIFTTGEEVGGIGAQKLIQDCPSIPFSCYFLVELDRGHSIDCVFYSHDDSDFTKFIEGYGFEEALGSFTDISVLMPAWEIAGVNLSIGYEYEHTPYEILHYKEMEQTIAKVEAILRDADNDGQFWKYKRREWTFASNDSCPICGIPLGSNAATITVRNELGTVKLCPSCWGQYCV